MTANNACHFAASENLVLVAHEPDKNMIPLVAGSHVRGSPLKASEACNEEIDLLLPGTARWVKLFCPFYRVIGCLCDRWDS